jgi:hypothetical protein
MYNFLFMYVLMYMKPFGSNKFALNTWLNIQNVTLLPLCFMEMKIM